MATATLPEVCPACGAKLHDILDMLGAYLIGKDAKVGSNCATCASLLHEYLCGGTVHEK